jgi:hypothetical protein
MVKSILDLRVGRLYRLNTQSRKTNHNRMLFHGQYATYCGMSYAEIMPNKCGHRFESIVDGKLVVMLLTEEEAFINFIG